MNETITDQVRMVWVHADITKVPRNASVHRSSDLQSQHKLCVKLRKEYRDRGNVLTFACNAINLPADDAIIKGKWSRLLQDRDALQVARTTHLENTFGFSRITVE